MENQFACVINCIDGRIQELVLNYMKDTYCVPFIDTITIAGPVKVLAENKKEKIIKDIKFRAGVSVKKHDSKVIAVIGHHDCALVLTSDDDQVQLVKRAVENVKTWFPLVEVIGLFVDGKWKINKVC